MGYETLIVKREENIGIVTLNRPPANPINLTVLEELDKVLTEFERDKTIRVLIITGAGEKGFSAGFDLKSAGEPGAEKTGPRGVEVLNRIEQFPKPIIAAINGFALGGGCELAMACHFRIMVDSERAIIGLPEIERGLIPGWGGTQRLPRLIGKTKALEIMIFGTKLRATEAQNVGLVTMVSHEGETMRDAKDFARVLGKKAPLAVKAILDSVNRGLEINIEDGLKIERSNADMVGNSQDAVEGIMAFLQKREPMFKGE